MQKLINITLGGDEGEEINWTLCVICQTDTTEKTCSTNDGLIPLSSSFEKFKVINALP